MPKFLDLTGKGFNYLSVLSYAGKNAAKENMWRCKCVCGAIVILRTKVLPRGLTKSCGCMKSEIISKTHIKHGHTSHNDILNRTYQSWISMKQRCDNPKRNQFKDYGGRGIKICDRWLASYENFLADMGERPEGLTLERNNVNGNYEPLNCRWATRKDQSNNKRDSKKFEFGEAFLTITEICAKFKLNVNTFRSRVRRG